MSIPDPTIDPITGLPIVGSSDVIEQIPLGNQIVDLPSYNADSRLTRRPIYPDDGIPTFSNVQGQHPTSNNAQTIQSDGNHALKVSVVNPSSGGGAIPAVPWKFTGNDYTTTGTEGGGYVSIDVGGIPSPVYYVSFAWDMTGVTGTYTGTWQWYIASGNGNARGLILAGHWSNAAGGQPVGSISNYLVTPFNADYFRVGVAAAVFSYSLYTPPAGIKIHAYVGSGSYT